MSMWVWVLNSFKEKCLPAPMAVALFVLLAFGPAGVFPEEAQAGTSPSFRADNTWQSAQVTPRRKPGDEEKSAEPKRPTKPEPASDPAREPEEALPREKPAIVPPESNAAQGFVWNERDLAAQGKQQAVLGIVIKVLAGALLALSAVVGIWSLSWRSGAVFAFTLSVWAFEFRSIVAGLDIGALGFLNHVFAPLAFMGLAATVMVLTVFGYHLPRLFRQVLLFGFGGGFLALLAAGFFAPDAILVVIRVLILLGALVIPVVLVITPGQISGRSFSFGLILVSLSILFVAVSPVLVNTGPGASPLLWLHVLFLVATFFINIPARLSNAYGENFPVPTVTNYGDPFPSSSSSQPRQRYAREERYEEPEPEYDDYENDDYDSDRRENARRENDRYEEVDETLEDEDRYALGVAAAHQGIWDWNIEYDELYLSASVDGMLGLPAGGLVRSEVGWAERVHADDFDAYRNALRTYLRRGNAPFDIQFRMRHESGDYIWMQLRATCLPDDDGIAARCIGTIADITQSRGAEDRLLHSASIDPLTGLMNRSSLNDRLNEALRGALGSAVQTGLIVIDLDRFKTVNDSLGHGAGDVLLQTVARRLEDAVGSAGLVARLGSDEFAILTNGTGASSRVIADRAMKALAQPVELDGYEVFPMASLGLANADQHHTRAEDVLKDAETAMFRAKRTGGGCVEVYESTMAQQSVETLSLETDLRRALERQQMEVLFQPIVNFRSNSVAGFEALLRWRHPVHGLLSPDQFVPMAEETDLIVSLGRFVLSMASQQLAHWHRVFPISPPLFVSVNVSSRQLKRRDFADDIREVLRESNLMPGTLKLEVTESLIMEDPHLAERLLSDVKAIGAGIVLDDFGTGFASMSNLQRYPFDTIKVDRSFVSTMDSRPGSHVIVNSIVNLANDLHLTVIAEGLESEDDTYRLHQMGCHYGQGFVFGAPMTAQDAQTFIAHNWHDQRGI